MKTNEIVWKATGCCGDHRFSDIPMKENTLHIEDAGDGYYRVQVQNAEGGLILDPLVPGVVEVMDVDALTALLASVQNP